MNSYKITTLFLGAAAAAASHHTSQGGHRIPPPAPSEYSCITPVYSDGKISLFGVLSNGSIWYKSSDPFGKHWAPEDKFAIIPASARDCPSVTASGATSPHLFYVNSTGTNVLYKHSDSSDSDLSDQRVEEEDLGGDMLAVSAIQSGEHQIDIFGLSDRRTYVYKQRQAKLWFPSQTEWKDLGGDFISEPAVTMSTPLRVELVGLHSHSASIQLKSFEFGEESEWQELESGGIQFIGNPQITSSGRYGKFDVWAIDSNGALHHLYYNGRGDYKEWENLGGEFEDTPSVVYSEEQDVIYIVGKDYEGTYYSKSYDGRSRKWTPAHKDWDTLVGPYSSEPGVLTTVEDETALFVFGVDAENTVKMQKGTERGWWPNSHRTKHIGTLPDFREQHKLSFGSEL